MRSAKFCRLYIGLCGELIEYRNYAGCVVGVAEMGVNVEGEIDRDGGLR